MYSVKRSLQIVPCDSSRYTFSGFNQGMHCAAARLIEAQYSSKDGLVISLDLTLAKYRVRKVRYS